MAVLLETSLGDITIDLYTKERPKCCLNFLKLCKIKYYNFCLFHSVQRNLVAQTGDPTGSGRGGNSIYAKLYGDQARYFDMETHPRIKHETKGLVSMVNNGNNMNGSQFFFTLGDDLDYLDGVHTVFGEVAEGEDALAKINEAYCDSEHRPYKDIRIYHTIILDDPFDDPTDLPIPDRSPEPTAEQLDSGRIGAEEDIDDTKGMAAERVQEMLSEKEARANAQLLEMVGDLPSADVKPEDNVLFVCKLNPVTSSDDLEIIFSRFGNISSCEVIKDQKSGESLQYAFIEFEKSEDCERAYFKMDNVLIDDRRIHVDFSQSVSKVKWRGKGKGVDHIGDKGKSEAAEYVLKTKPRQDGGKYGLLFDDHDLTGSKSHKKKKTHKKYKHSSSNEDSNDEHRKKKHKHKSKRLRSDSASPMRLAVKERRRRSRSRSYEKRDRYSDTRREGDYKERWKEDASYRRGSDRYRSDRR